MLDPHCYYIALVPKGVFVAMLHLEIVPRVPKPLVLPRIRQRRRKHVHRPRPVDLPQLALQGGILDRQHARVGV